VRKIETLEKGENDAIGNKVRVKVVKNKVAPPFRKVELEIMFGKGLSASGSLLDAAVKYELIDKKGAWYSAGEEKIGQGRDNAKLYLENNPEYAANLEKKLREIMFPNRVLGNASPDKPKETKKAEPVAGMSKGISPDAAEAAPESKAAKPSEFDDADGLF
jgi:recombination protein RecA